MSAPTATNTAEYELVLMLDPEAPDERRDQIADEARQRITSGGELKHDQVWGMRKMAYEIRQRTEADYRFFRFDALGPLLDELDHSLKIADGVLRFRIFKVDPSSPAIEPPPPVSLAGSASRGGPPRRGAPAGRPPRATAETGAPDSRPSEPAPAPEPAEAPPAPDSPPVDEPAAPPAEPETPDSPPAEPEQGAPAEASEGEEPAN
jgi:small subunit ribosomal protein S6